MEWELKPGKRDGSEGGRGGPAFRTFSSHPFSLKIYKVDLSSQQGQEARVECDNRLTVQPKGRDGHPYRQKINILRGMAIFEKLEKVTCSKLNRDQLMVLLGKLCN